MLREREIFFAPSGFPLLLLLLLFPPYVRFPSESGKKGESTPALLPGKKGKKVEKGIILQFPVLFLVHLWPRRKSTEKKLLLLEKVHLD